MLKMYGFWRSAATFRVRAALNLKGLAFEETMIDLDAGEQDAPAYRAVNTAGAVPALFVDDGPPLTQSLAILEYLEELHPAPALLPADPRGRARVRALALLFAADHHPLIVPRVRRYLGEEFAIGDDGRATWVKHWFREGLVLGEARLAGDRNRPLLPWRYAHVRRPLPDEPGLRGPWVCGPDRRPSHGGAGRRSVLGA